MECFSIRASSPDQSMVSEWRRINISGLESKQYTRLDFQLFPKEESSPRQTARAGSGAQTFSRINQLLVFQMLSIIYYIYCT